MVGKVEGLLVCDEFSFGICWIGFVGWFTGERGREADVMFGLGRKKNMVMMMMR